MQTIQKVGTAQLLFTRAQQMGLQPSWLTHQGVFAVNTVLGEKYINYSSSSLNSRLDVSLALNKYLTRLILARHDMPNIPFANAATLAEATEFLALHKKIIVKPLKGSNSHDVRIVTDPADLPGDSIHRYILEKYIAGKEMRYLILNGEVIGVHQSEYGESVEETRDLQRISYSSSEWDPALAEQSVKVAGIFGLRFGCVDYLVDAQGQAHILEINSAPGMKWFHAPTTGPPVDVARLFLQAMLTDLDQQWSILKK